MARLHGHVNVTTSALMDTTWIHLVNVYVARNIRSVLLERILQIARTGRTLFVLDAPLSIAPVRYGHLNACMPVNLVFSRQKVVVCHVQTRCVILAHTRWNAVRLRILCVLSVWPHQVLCTNGPLVARISVYREAICPVVRV